MGKIRILSDEVASQVAAGEVVERPASLVKELVDNSLDAGATRITVEFSQGGSRQVSVRDDGCGMDREDALLSLERHATSKIRTGHDLAEVRTMGFRGEALPSIASVSRFRLVTRPAADASATEVLVNGGKFESVADCGAAPGTLVEVRDLFFNLPARRKFLRGPETEAAHILHGIEAVSLAYPKVAFEGRKDGKAVINLPRSETLAVRVRDLFGAEFLDGLTELEPVVAMGFSLSGLVARPGRGRRDRLRQFVILNGRPVQCPAVQQPLREAFAGSLPRGEHPPAVLCIEMDPALVDCNVHPAKREVRLRQPEALRQVVFDAARSSLERARSSISRPSAVSASPTQAVPAPQAFSRPAPAPELPLRSAPRPAAAPTAPPSALPVSSSHRPSAAPIPARPPGPAPETPAPSAAPPPAAPPDPDENRFRLAGWLGSHYLLLEGEDGLVLLDIRSATERILYEGLLRQMDQGEVACQRLLLPEVAELPAREHAWVCEHREDLQAAGFLFEPFGGSSVKIEGTPALTGDRPPGEFLHDVAASLRATGRIPPGRGLREALARTVSRVASDEKAIRNEDKAMRLVRELLRCELPYASPSGRPTLIQFSFSELNRKFGRGS